MRFACHDLIRLSAVLVGMLPAAAASGQAVRPAAETREPAGPFKMEIYNGPNRTVHYFPGTTSPGEAAALRDLERSENEVAYLEGLQTLRQQYVNDERFLQTNRSVVQDRLYGLAVATSSSS